MAINIVKFAPSKQTGEIELISTRKPISYFREETQPEIIATATTKKDAMLIADLLYNHLNNK